MTGQEIVRKRPALFRALGNADPPVEVAVGGRPCRLQRVFKHDSWAATALYDGGGEIITCKFNRTQSAFGLPLRWLGRVLANREAGFLRRLAHLELVPDLLGEVTFDGRRLDYAVARVFVEGEVFRAGSTVDARFFEELRRLLDGVHACAIAYVDLHKRENVIIGTDGRPHLIDFQVSLGLGRRWPGNGRLMRFVVRKLQEMDDYHYRKHLLSCLPHLLSPEERMRYSEIPPFIRAHRKVARPLRELRRRLLVRLKIRSVGGKAETELEPEDAFRKMPAPPPATGHSSGAEKP